MSVVMIGVDPHKASVSIEARDTVTERLVATGRFEMSTPGYRQLRALAKQWKDRVWVIEGTSGTGRPLAQRLLADGETVLDVPAKLAARSRVFDTGQGRKTAAGKTGAEAMRCLKRRLSDAVYRQLVADATARQDTQTEQGQLQVVAAGRVGHPGASDPSRRVRRLRSVGRMESCREAVRRGGIRRS